MSDTRDKALTYADDTFRLGFVKGVEHARRLLGIPDVFETQDIAQMEEYLQHERKQRQDLEAA